MKFIITAGGTAGHINPALALAEELEARGHTVVFAGTPNRLEATLVPEAGYKFVSFDAVGFNRKKPISLVKSVLSISNSTKMAKKWLSSVKPDAVIGFGCYVSIAICRAASKLNIPYYIHEQNSVMGLANKFLSKKTQATCLTYKRADTGKCNNVVVTGNPVRKSVYSATFEEGRQMLNIPQDAKVLLVFGGSLGAAKINESICAMADELLNRKDLYIVHITGKAQYDKVKNNIKLSDDKLKRYLLFSYQNQMGKVLAAADLCISRAGASTLAEITVRCLPALLVPFPNATENHQFYNAQTLVDAGCVMYINDNAVQSQQFNDSVIKLVDDDNLRIQMKESYKQFDFQNAASYLGNILEGLTRGQIS